tara:strand:+ start:10458 stop:11966 length:1509 start_codon:yes stop_codon:yes gene_type:complete
MSSFGRDVLYKVLSQGISFATSLVTMGLVARSLGPSAYGIYNFIADFFQKFQKLILAGSMTGYYVKLSKNVRNQFTTSYHIYLLALIPVSLLMVSLAFILEISDFIWPNKETSYVYYGVLIIFLSVQNKGLSHTFDGSNATKYYEILLTFGYIFNATSIVTLYYFEILNLSNYFFYNIFYQSFLMIFGLLLAFRKRIVLIDDALKNHLSKNLKEIFDFSRPLVFYAIFVFFVGIADRWLIEYFYGEYDQGIFSISFKIASLILLLAAPFERLLLRESSKLAEKNLNEFKRFIESSFCLSLFVGVSIASFISVNSDIIISIIGGEAYRDAYLCLFILSFAFGINFVTHFMANINLAQEKTMTHVFLGVPINLISLSISCFLLIPNSLSPDFQSFNSVAIKTLTVVCIHLFLVTTVISSRLKLNNFYLLVSGIMIPTVLYFTANMSRMISEYISSNILSFIFSSIIYFLFVGTLLVLILCYDNRQKNNKETLASFLNNLGIKLL